jgi:hypothetical protein
MAEKSKTFHFISPHPASSPAMHLFFGPAPGEIDKFMLPISHDKYSIVKRISAVKYCGPADLRW